MYIKSKAINHRWFMLGLVVFGLIAALIILPYQFNSKAGSTNETGEGLIERTTSHVEGLENYDIREEDAKEASESLLEFRQKIGKSASDIADVSEGFARGEDDLRTRVSTLKVEYSTNLKSPQVISPDVWKADIERLSAPSELKRSDILRNFIKQNSNLIGVSTEQADALKVTADYTNPNGYLSFAYLNQFIHGVPVYRGEIRAGFTKSGELIRVLSELAPGVDYSAVSTEFGDPLNAVRKSYGYINAQTSKLDVQRNDATSTDLKVIFGSGDWATTAEKMYFPTEIGVVRPSWRVLIWQPVNAFYVIVDAETGIMLSRENITQDQAQSATYEVLPNANGYMNAAESPAPLTPGPVNPTLGTQGVNIPRINRLLIGTELGNPGMNNLGWITDNTNITDGNNLEAGIDRDGTNGVDAPQAGDTACPGAGCRVFTSPLWNPPPGNPAPGDDPLITRAQRGAVIQMFYVMNLYHDALYSLGWNEQARNFQNDNFGRGGVGNDRVSAEGQDSSGTNNANMSTPADGGRGRMQMFVWTGPTPDYDGTADADIIIHEITHGLSTRLHNGLGNQGSMMGEGWGDWYAHTMLAEPSDPINGVYTTGGYATYLGGAGFTSNYYYGIRRFPKAVIAFTGGPNNRPHNPLTFRHINADCDTTIGTSTNAIISAFPRNPVFGPTGNCSSSVHNAGEIWSSALWEVRGLMVTRLGFTAGTRRVLQVVTDGMKLAPANPMMLQERDAIIAAASALPVAPEAAADVVDVREGFRRRGMGFSAMTISSSSVVEAFDAADVVANNGSVTSGNGLLEPNECNTLNVPILNNSGNTATGITAVLSTTTPGITVNQPNSAYPNIPGGGGPVNNTTPFQVSVDNTVACFTNASFTLTVNFAGGGGGSSVSKTFSLPVGLQGSTYSLTQTTGTIPGTPASATLVPSSQQDDTLFNLTAPFAFSIYDTNVASGATLRGGPNGNIQFVATGGTTSFSNVALPTGGTFPAGAPTLLPYWDDLIMTTTRFATAGVYEQVLGSAPNRQWVVEWRAQHFSNAAADGMTTNFAVVFNEGSSAFSYVYATTGTGGTTVNANGASATVGVQASNAGTQFTQFSFNQPVIVPGSRLNAVLPPATCAPGSGTCNAAPASKRADFDGDGKTDLSVFRPSEGNWYVNRSTEGFSAVNFGASSDTLVPADFDGDGKTDRAVFRPSNVAGNPDFHILRSSDSTVSGVAWGNIGDIPMVADYDGDSKADAAVFRPSSREWFILNSGNGSNTIAVYGLAGDIPVAGNFVGDSKADLNVFRPSNGTWYSKLPGGGDSIRVFGLSGDTLVPADYDGDGLDDLAVFRAGVWYVLRTTNSSVTITNWGLATDTPVPGDFDGDGKYDIAVYRSGTWYLNQSTAGSATASFGAMSDTAVPRRYLP